MPTYVAFLRAVNIGKRQVKMERLRAILADAGFTDVETYIQTGNARFGSSMRSTVKVAVAVEELLESSLGFDVSTVVRTPAQLRGLVTDSPDSPLGAEARHYVGMLRDDAPKHAVAELDAWDVQGERIKVVGRDVHLWLHKPYNQVQATNARIEKITGCRCTNRDWKVVAALAEKWGG